MFDLISFIILREIFINIIKQKDILNFKISLKRISLFVNSDRVCQEHYIKIGYNLNFDLNSNDHFKNYKNLILHLDKKQYSKFYRPKFEWSCGWKIFVRPSDDCVIAFGKTILSYGNCYYLMGCFENHIFLKLQKSIEKEDDDFEKIMNSNGFFQVINLLICSDFEIYHHKIYNENKNIIYHRDFSDDFKNHYINNIIKIGNLYYND